MKIGFLGAGAMGGAILSGAINAGVLDPKQVYISDMSDKIKEKYAALGCNIVKDNEELGRAADIAVLAVKPQYAAPALAGFGAPWTARQSSPSWPALPLSASAR